MQQLRCAIKGSVGTKTLYLGCCLLSRASKNVKANKVKNSWRMGSVIMYFQFTFFKL